MVESNVQGIRGEYRRLNATEVGFLISLTRKQQGIKRAALAADAHMSEKTLERAESGLGISEDSSRRIARALGFQEDAFVSVRYIPAQGELERMLKRQEEELRATHQLQPVAEIKGVRDVRSLFQCELFFADDQYVAEEDLEAFADLQESLWEGNAVWEDISSPERVKVAQNFLAEIRAFEARGYVMKSGTSARELSGTGVSVAVMTAFKQSKSVSGATAVWVPKKMSVGF